MSDLTNREAIKRLALSTAKGVSNLKETGLYEMQEVLSPGFHQACDIIIEADSKLGSNDEPGFLDAYNLFTLAHRHELLFGMWAMRWGGLMPEPSEFLPRGR